jgi:hypothetical protein
LHLDVVLLVLEVARREEFATMLADEPREDTQNEYGKENEEVDER